MAMKFNETFETLIMEANLKQRVLGIVKEYCRKGVEVISLYSFITAWAADKKLDFVEINDAIAQLAMDQVKNLSGIPATLEVDEVDMEITDEDYDGQPEDLGVEPTTELTDLPAVQTQPDVIDNTQIIIDAIKEYIDKKLEKTMTLTSYLNSFVNDYNAKKPAVILGYDEVQKALTNLVLDYCKSQLNEKKEDGLKVSPEEVENAFKDYTGARIPGGEGDDKKIEDFDMEQMTKGIMMEFEHTSDVNFALEIVIDHLSENSKYYDYLEEMETKMDADAAKENEVKESAKTIKEQNEIVFPEDLIAKSKIFDILKNCTSKIPTLCDHTIKVLAIEIYDILKNVEETNARMNRITVLLTAHNYVMNTESTVLYNYIIKALES